MKTINLFLSSRLLILPALLVLSCSGCSNLNSYIDPQFRVVSRQSLSPLPARVPVIIETDSQANGRPNDKPLQSLLRQKIIHVLWQSGTFTEAIDSGSSAGRLSISINNLADGSSAVAKGVITGLSGGLVGSKVVDRFVMIATYAPVGNSQITKEYRHVLYTTIGARTSPPGMIAVPPGKAYETIVEDLILNFLGALQANNIIK
jgi:hypothetical protein